MTSPRPETEDGLGELPAPARRDPVPRSPVPRSPTPREPLLRGQWSVVAVIAVGGAAGASARYGAALLRPGERDGFPWTTFWVNVTGCFVIGVLMVLVTEVWAPHRLVRPFFGTGVLGGFTTFSTYAVDIQRLLDTGRPGTALAYLAATLVAALTAVWLAATLTRAATGRGSLGTGPDAAPPTGPYAGPPTGPDGEPDGRPGAGPSGEAGKPS